MHDCLDTDELTSLCSALGWNAEARLKHLEQCEVCQATLREVAAVREVLASSEAVSPEWLAETHRAIEREAAAASPAASRPGVRAAAALFALAGASTMVLLIPPNGVPGGTFSPGLAAALSVGVGAAVAAYYTWRNRLLGSGAGERRVDALS